MTTQYNSNYNETMAFSDTVKQIACGVGVEQTYTIPGDYHMQYQATFEYAYNSNVFVCKNAVPVVPAVGTVGAQPYNEFKPTKRYVQGGDVLHFITPDVSAYIGVSLRQIQG